MLAENPALELLTALQQDARASARRLAESYRKRQAKKLAEEARLQAMYQYEEQAASQVWTRLDGGLWQAQYLWRQLSCQITYYCLV